MSLDAPVRTKDFLSVLDFEPGELEACLALAAKVKRDRALGRKAPTADALGGAHVALLFEKPSLRTISTFEIAVRELGGQVITPFPVAALSEREPAADVARNLERWVKCVVMRTYAQSTSPSSRAPRRGCTSSTRSATRSIRVRRWPIFRRSGSVGRLGRTDGRVRRRRQQRRDLARAGRRDARHDVPHRLPEGIRAACGGRRTGDEGGPARRADQAVSRIRSKPSSRRRRRSTPTSGRRWVRKPRAPSASGRSTATR